MQKKHILIIVTVLTFQFSISQVNTTKSASDYLFSLPIHDRDLIFSTSKPGTPRSVEWGLDLAWLSEANVARGVAFMGKENVSVIRSSFQPTYPLVGGQVTNSSQINAINERARIINLHTNLDTKIALNSDHPSVDAYFVGNATNWSDLIESTAKLHVSKTGRKIQTVSPFNEPDYSVTGQGTIDDFKRICIELQKRSYFDSIRVSGGNTLNNDQALYWYNYLKDYLEEGNTHQLAGNFDTFVTFLQTVVNDGRHLTQDEMHNVMEAMVGAHYGMNTGIWWGTAELARGEFCQTARPGGEELAYSEHRPNWTAASVYRSPAGKVQAFGGTSERQSATTSYRFVSKDRDVYFDGYGPQREYSMTMPGGTGYQVGQTNAERVVNITWGDDIQPVIDGKYVLVNRKSKKVIEVPYGATGTGANVWQRTYIGAEYQHWNVKPVDSRVGGDFSYFTFTAAHSGKSFDLLNYSLSNAAGIIVWDDVKSGNQQFYLDYIEDGWFYIRSRHSAKCLEVANGLVIDGAKIQQYDIDGDLNQQWRFIPVGASVEFTAPAAPAGLSAISNAQSILLNWNLNAESDLKAYTIYRSDSLNGKYETIARDVQVTSFVDNKIEAGKTYFYKLRALDKSLNRSEYSDVISASASGVKDVLTRLEFEKTLRDTTINLNHSSASGTIAYSTGKSGNSSLSLNGINSFVQLSPVIANQDEITVSTWVYLMGFANWMRIFDFGNGPDQNMYLTPRSNNSQLRFAIKNGGVEQSLNSTALSLVKWTHVAVTLGKSGAAMYVNGVKVDESADITIRPNDFKPVLNYIGKSQYADPLLKGYIDDFRVYNYALSSDEVARLAGSLIDNVTPVRMTDFQSVQIFDIQGRLILSSSLNDGQELKDIVKQLKAGVYVIKTIGALQSNIQKVVIE